MLARVLPASDRRCAHTCSQDTMQCFSFLPHRAFDVSCSMYHGPTQRGYDGAKTHSSPPATANCHGRWGLQWMLLSSIVFPACSSAGCYYSESKHACMIEFHRYSSVSTLTGGFDET